MANFFRINIENNSWWIAQKLVSKKVKEYLQRRTEGTWVAMDCNRNQSEPLQKLYCRYFHDILSFNGVSIDGKFLMESWLNIRRELIPCILKEGKVLANEGCRVNKIHRWDLVFRGWKKLPTGKENEKRYHKDQMLIYWLCWQR